MTLRDLLDQVIRTTLEGRYEDALLMWSTRHECAPENCTIHTAAGVCSSVCVLPRLLEMSLVYNRDNAYNAYQQLKEYVGSEAYQQMKKEDTAS
jgi:hypothetical protein